MTAAKLKSVEESHVQPTNGEVQAAILAKLDQVLDTLRTQGSELVELRARLQRLETPPTKAELAEMVRERDAEIAHLRRRIAGLEASRG